MRYRGSTKTGSIAPTLYYEKVRLMSDVLFDEQNMAEELERTGVPPEQARAHAALFAGVRSMDAVEQKVARGLSELRIEIQQLEARVEVRLAKMDSRIAAVEVQIAELRAWAEARLAELKAELDKGFAQVGTRFAQVDSRLAELKAELDTRFARLDVAFAHVDTRFAQVETRFAQLEARLAETKTDLIRWGITVVLSVGLLQTAFISALLVKLLP
jgi:chaperonin cofactor prefoldin